MNESTFYLIVYIWIGVAIFIFPAVVAIGAPYGRHISIKWGVLIDNRLGWIMMELPALLVFAIFYLTGSGDRPAVTWIFFGLWVIHYINRTLVFPFRLRTPGKKMPLAVVFMAIFFNFINGYINGYYLGSLATSDLYPLSYITDPRFISGIILFAAGMMINMSADNTLIHLRKPGETGYIIPQGGLFRFISCPNHFGEIIEWTGFAVMVWSSPAVAFAIWTGANLLPRALQHHRWYQQTFSDYPLKRKAVIPFIL